MSCLTNRCVPFVSRIGQHARAAAAFAAVAVLALSCLAVSLPSAARAQPSVGTSVATEQPAQVVVLDTSGSMDDSDSGGGTKLDGAKTTIAHLFRALPGRSELGV